MAGLGLTRDAQADIPQTVPSSLFDVFFKAGNAARFLPKAHMTPQHLQPVPLDKAYRLMNHGPTVLVSAQHAGQANVMAAAWACVLDFTPPKVTVVLDKATATRALVEASGEFTLQLPTRAMVSLTTQVGTVSARQQPHKMADLQVPTFTLPGSAVPLVAGCVGWLRCRLVPEPHNQQAHDLFIGEVTAAWADGRVFSGGRWHFDAAPSELRTIHHVAGGQYLVSGEAVQG